MQRRSTLFTFSFFITLFLSALLLLGNTTLIQAAYPHGSDPSNDPAPEAQDDLDAILHSNPLPGLSVSLDQNGSLLVEETAGSADNHLVLSYDGSSLLLSDNAVPISTDLAQASGGGLHSMTIPIAQISGEQLILNAGSGDDTLTIDFGDGSHPFPMEIVFNGQTQTNMDTLELTGAATVDEMLFTFENEHDGTVKVSGNPLITYTGLEPITSSITASDVTLTYGATSETITITNAGSGQTTVDSTSGEVVTFNNPTSQFSILAGEGDDTIVLSSLAAAFPAEIAFAGQMGTDTVNVQTPLSTTSALAFNVETILLGGGSIETSGGQTYAGAVTLQSDNTLTNNPGGNIEFSSTVDGNYALTVDNNTPGGFIELYGDLGSTTPLNAFTAQSELYLYSGNLITMGDQSYSFPVKLLTDVTLHSQNSNITIFNFVFLDTPYDLSLYAPNGSITWYVQLGHSSYPLDTVTLEAATVNSGTNGDIHASNINFLTDELQLGWTISGTGVLKIAPRTPGLSIGLGGGTGALNLDSWELAYLQDGFSQIEIGDQTGSPGHIQSFVSTFLDPLVLYSGSITAPSASPIEAPQVVMNGTVAPGQMGPGELAVTGLFSFAAGASYAVEIGGTNSTDHDRIIVNTGPVLINAGTTLNPISYNSYVPSGGEEFVILSNTGSSGIVSTFSGLPEGATLANFLGSGLDATISYVGGDGNDIVLTVADPPPEFESITRQTPATSPTNADTLVFLATFNEDVLNVDATDFEITGTTATHTVTQQTASTYEVTVTGGDLADLNGTVGLNLASAQDITDTGGNALPAGEPATDETYVMENTMPSVTIDQGTAQADPTNTSPIVFDVVFSETVTGFDENDVLINGVAGTPTVVVSGANDTYTVEVSGMADGETVMAEVRVNAAQDAAGNDSLASTSTDNQVTYDLTAIQVLSGGVIGYPGEHTITNHSSIYTRLTALEVMFDTSPNDPVGDSDPDDATNPNNYLLLQTGSNGVYDTVSCQDYANNGNAALPDDEQITVNSVVHDLPTMSVYLMINNGLPLDYGDYRLMICGTTSITDLAGNTLNGGADVVIDFLIEQRPDELPDTGFPLGQVTVLPKQPTEKAYADSGLMLEIPSLGVEMSIVGVSQVDDGWDVTWLGNNAGYLAGSAFPTWAGNTVLTGHVWNAYNQPGPFVDLKNLRYGDRFDIHAWGQTYTYEVRENKLLFKRNVDAVFAAEENDWVTLLTCEFYNPITGKYISRRMVRAVLVSVK